MKPGGSATAGRQPILFRAESLSQSLGLYLPATIATRLIGFARGVALAWLISRKSEFGLFQITLLAVNILNPLCNAGLNEAVARYVPQHETRRSLRPYLARTVPFTLGVSLLLSGIAYLAAEPLAGLLFATFDPAGEVTVPQAQAVYLTRLVIGTTFALIAYFLLLAVLKGLRMFRVVSLMELVNNLAFTLLAIVVALGGQDTAAAMLACYAVTLAAVVAVFTPPLYAVLHGTERQQQAPEALVAGRPASVIGQMLRFSTWAAMAAVLWQFLQYYPMWYLNRMHGTEATAVFGSIRHITQMVLVGAVAVVTVVQTSVTKTWESSGPADADRRLALAHKTTALLMFVGCAALITLGNVVIRILPARYHDGLAIMSVSLLFFAVGGHLAFLAIHFNLIEKTRHLFMPWAIGVAGNVLFAAWLVKAEMDSLTALKAAAWSGVLSVSAALVTCLVLLRVERRPLDFGGLALILLSFALALPAMVLIPLTLVVLMTALATDRILSRDEKDRLHHAASGGWERTVRVFLPRAPR